jgi:hypothetical protein
MRGLKFFLLAAILIFLAVFPLTVRADHPQRQADPGVRTVSLQNEHVRFTVVVDNGRLAADRLEARPAWLKAEGGAGPAAVETDADFGLEVMVTAWSAPGKVNNAENPVVLAKKDFILTGQELKELPDGTRELALDLKGRETTISLRLTYQLGPEAFYVRRNLSARDMEFGHHFLRWFWTRRSRAWGLGAIVKSGGFGQPAAALLERGGVFFGVEYPAAENHLEMREGRAEILCGQEFGRLIGADWLSSDWAVEGLAPNAFVKYWFFQYLDQVRAAPLRPFSLYNTWYDLRSPEYPNWSADKVMCEQSTLRMVDLLRTKMLDKYGMRLDAFVLDDGWDVYESDWVLRGDEWPRGLKPLADELRKTGTALGLWLGPTGGYSFRMKRVNWMREHGYEVVGQNKDDAMLCLAGKKYGALLKKRVVDFVANDGVGYFKWDGIQFSCSEPDHGHPIDIYSRRAVMESLADMCRAVRRLNPSIFLNITSGTWLSPWWVKFADAIWMQGMDYGFADVPSLSRRDGAITYRDFILYDDLRQQDFWFPLANLMTHGIIKGKNESVGAAAEPLDKFTDDVLLYFARGVSMYELYVSPDILSDGEWTSIARSMAWARDRFPVLMNSAMTGGNPLKGEAYAYVHFKGRRGIVAVRNPAMEPARLKVKLDPAVGLDPGAGGLVLERVYPTGWVSPRLYRSGESVVLPLDGFETAVYELYPVGEASRPLLAGAAFDIVSEQGKECLVQYYGVEKGAKLLNPEIIESAMVEGKSIGTGALSLPEDEESPLVTDIAVRPEKAGRPKFTVRFNLSETGRESALALLMTPDPSAAGGPKPGLSAWIDGAAAAVKTEPQEGRSQWFTVDIRPGKHEILVEARPGGESQEWKGSVAAWLVAKQKQPTKTICFQLKAEAKPRPLPPKAWAAGEVKKSVKLGEVALLF